MLRFIVTMFNIRILCLHNMLYIRPSKKETSFSSELFLKEEGGPYYLLFMNFLLV